MQVRCLFVETASLHVVHVCGVCVLYMLSVSLFLSSLLCVHSCPSVCWGEIGPYGCCYRVKLMILDRYSSIYSTCVTTYLSLFAGPSFWELYHYGFSSLILENFGLIVQPAFSYFAIWRLVSAFLSLSSRTCNPWCIFISHGANYSWQPRCHSQMALQCKPYAEAVASIIHMEGRLNWASIP